MPYLYGGTLLAVLSYVYGAPLPFGTSFNWPVTRQAKKEGAGDLVGHILLEFDYGKPCFTIRHDRRLKFYVTAEVLFVGKRGLETFQTSSRKSEIPPFDKHEVSVLSWDPVHRDSRTKIKSVVARVYAVNASHRMFSFPITKRSEEGRVVPTDHDEISETTTSTPEDLTMQGSQRGQWEKERNEKCICEGNKKCLPCYARQSLGLA